MEECPKGKQQKMKLKQRKQMEMKLKQQQLLNWQEQQQKEKQKQKQRLSSYRFLLGNRIVDLEGLLRTRKKSLTNPYKFIPCNYASSSNYNTSCIKPKLSSAYIVGSCDGLICLVQQSEILIWNPYTGLFRSSPVLQPWEWPSRYYGFGYDYTTRDYKIVYMCSHDVMCSEDEIAIFTREADSWRIIRNVVVGHRTFLRARGLYFKGGLYWIVISGSEKVILRFDLGDDKFEKVHTIPFSTGEYALYCVNSMMGHLLYFTVDEENLELTIWMIGRRGGRSRKKFKQFSIWELLHPEYSLVEKIHRFKYLHILQGRFILIKMDDQLFLCDLEADTKMVSDHFGVRHLVVYTETLERVTPTRVQVQDQVLSDPELLVRILSFLPLKDLDAAKCVSKLWGDTVYDLPRSRVLSDPKLLMTILSFLPVEDIDTPERVCKFWCDVQLSRNRFLLVPQSIEITPKFIDFEELKNPTTVPPNIPSNSTGIEFLASLRPSLFSHCIVGSCNGWICLLDSRIVEIIIWNPNTNHFCKSPLPFDVPIRYGILGFGYDYTSRDYKIVLVEKGSSGKVTIFTREAHSWRTVKDSEHENVTFLKRRGFYFEGALYWIGRKENEENKMVILKFDLGDDKFKTVFTFSKSNTEDPLHKMGAIGGWPSYCTLDKKEEEITIWMIKEDWSREKFKTFSVMLFTCDTGDIDVQILQDRYVLFKFAFQFRGMSWVWSLYDLKAEKQFVNCLDGVERVIVYKEILEPVTPTISSMPAQKHVLLNPVLLKTILSFLAVEDIDAAKCVSKFWRGRVSDLQLSRNRYLLVQLKSIPKLIDLKAMKISEAVDPRIRRHNGEFRVVGSCNSLVCLIGDVNFQITLWNPTTDDSDMLPKIDGHTWNVRYYGFGYDYITKDYKLVIGGYSRDKHKVAVLVRKKKSWKTFDVLNDFDFDTRFEGAGCYCRGSLYWTGGSREATLAVYRFDLGRQEFEAVFNIFSSSVNELQFEPMGIAKSCPCYFTYDGDTNEITVWMIKEDQFGVFTREKFRTVPLFKGCTICTCGFITLLENRYLFASTEGHWFVYDLEAKHSAKKYAFSKRADDRPFMYKETFESPK